MSTDTSMSALDDGIHDQLATLQQRIAQGMPRAGWKICVNDARMQKKFGITSSFVGFLDGAHRLESGHSWPVADGAILGVEPEFAIYFDEAVSTSSDRDSIRHAIAGVAPALEVVDWRDVKLELHAMAASSSFHAGFVVGELRSLDCVPPIRPDCPLLRRGEEILGVPDPALVPADLSGLVADVAEFLGRYGQRIEADDWLLCGACTNPARVEAGDRIDADFGKLGSVWVEFREESAGSRTT